MKIITRLKWAQWLCVAGVALAVLLMIGATRQVKQELQRNERAGEIVSGVVALRYLSLEYAQTQERRSHVQWQLRKDSLQGMLLRDDLFREEQEAQLLHDLQENLLLARHFSELLLVRQELRATPERSEVLHLLEARLFGQLMSRTQDMIRDAEELARRSRQGVLQAQQNASAVAAGLGLLLALTVLGALALTIRSVAHPLERLRRGAELVGSGKLDFRMNMKTVDEVGDLARAFDAMTERLRATTVSRDELVSVNSALHDEMEVRHGAELKVQAQLGRLSLLHQMTRSIGERQDLRSILQVLVRSLEDQLPVDFACVFLLQEGVLEASCVGLGNAALPGDAALKEGAQLAIDNNGLSRCVKGQLVYEPDISGNEYPFPHRLARGGLCSLVLAPLQAERGVRRVGRGAHRPECLLQRRMRIPASTERTCGPGGAPGPVVRRLAAGLPHPACDPAVGHARRAPARPRPDGKRHRARHQQRHFAGGAVHRNLAGNRNRLERQRPQPPAGDRTRHRRRGGDGGAHARTVPPPRTADGAGQRQPGCAGAAGGRPDARAGAICRSSAAW